MLFGDMRYGYKVYISYKSSKPRRKEEMKVDGSRCHGMLHYWYKIIE